MPSMSDSHDMTGDSGQPMGAMIDNLQADAESSSYSLSENIVADIVYYSRGDIIMNEEQAVLTTVGWLTGWLDNPKHYFNNIILGTSGAGKSHLIDTMKQIIPHEVRYETTDATASGIVDDPEWDSALVVIMSEWNKLDKPIREFMKSVAGDDGGFQKNRSMYGKDDANDVGPAGTDSIFKKPMPFSFSYAQNELDYEMWTRTFKTYIDESEDVNYATGRKQFDHTDIEVAGELPYEYIYDTASVEQALRNHIASMPTNIQTVIPEWIWYSVESILDMRKSESKRVASMLANAIRGSCALNYKQREMTDGAYVVDAQDVANILACRKTLLGTTHELEPRKLKIIEAVKQNTRAGEESVCVIEEIQEYLTSDKSDMSQLKRSDLRELLKELESNFIIKIHDRYQGNANGYEFKSMQQIGHPTMCDVHGHSEPFADCVDPIREQPIIDTVTDFRETLTTDWEKEEITTVAGAMGDPAETHSTSQSSTQSDTDEQVTFGSETPTITDLLTATVYDVVSDVSDGRTLPTDQIDQEAIMGITEPGTTVMETDVTGTLADPAHDVWDQSGKPDGWIQSRDDAIGELEVTYRELQQMDVIQYNTHMQDESIDEGMVRIDIGEVDIEC